MAVATIPKAGFPIRSWAIAVLIAFLIALGFFLQYCQRYIEFDIAFPGNSWVHLFHSKGGEAGRFKYKGVKVNSSGRPTIIRLPLITLSADALILRVDRPGGVVSLTNLRIVNGSGTILTTIERDQVENSAASMIEERPGGVNLHPTGLSEIIDVRLNFDKPLELVPDGAFLLFTKIFFPCWLFLYFLLEGGWFLSGKIKKTAFSGWPTALESTSERSAGLPTLSLITAGIFLIILGSRLWLVHRFGSELPFWDQWGAEATYLYLPYISGTLSPGDLFIPHNEHQIFITKIVSLGLVLLNGKWDPLLQMTINAILYASVGTFMFRSLMITSPLLWGAAVATLFSLPFGWQNTLGGFQLQVYLLIGLSLLFFWFMTCAESQGRKWIGGGICATLLLGTMASGFLACVAFLSVAILVAYKSREPARIRKLMPVLLFSLVFIGAGILLKETIAAHVPLQAHSANEFATSFAAYLGWPLAIFPTIGASFPGATASLFCAAILLWLPFILLLRKFMKENNLSKKMTLLIATGIWVILQVAAAAFARGTNMFPPSRYQDIFAMGLLVNTAAILWLVLLQTDGKTSWQIKSIALLWSLGALSGLLLVTAINIVHDLPEKRAQQQAGIEHARDFITTGNIDALSEKPKFDIPHDDKEKLADLLKNGALQRILPPAITGSGTRGRLSSFQDALLDLGGSITVAGVIIFGFGMLAGNRFTWRRSNN